MKIRKGPQVIIRKKNPEEELCILVENGVPCQNRRAVRGLCYAHIGYLRRIKTFEEFALPRKRMSLKPNPDAAEGICRLLVNGVPCSSPALQRGLCKCHYQTIWKRADLKLEDFAVDHVKPGLLRKRYPVEGVCVIRERMPDGSTAPCTGKARGRGLCRSHYRRLEGSPELFASLANPPREKDTFRLKKSLEPGQCAIIHNNVPCVNPGPGFRRVCHYHYSALRQAGMLEELTAQFKNKIDVFERKPDSAIVEGFCCMIVNGVRCTSKTWQRGLCLSCYQWIKKTHGAEFEKLALPDSRQKPEAALRRRHPLVKGLCLLVVDEVPCRCASKIRGLCDAHYALVRSRKLLDQIALTAAQMQTLPDTPHFYFDKNVVIDFVRHELFRDATVPESVALVMAVLRQKIFATISLDCTRALYSYLGHRLARPVDEGGKSLPPREAEKQAREYIGQLFFRRGGLWQLLPFREEQMEFCTAGQRLPELSLEDALEVHLYAQAKAECGVTMFVTADYEILERSGGVHPRKVVEAFTELQALVPKGREGNTRNAV
ncbi:MAG: hypothetical protein WAX69_18975 [Victivallales bacterium]